MFVFEPFSYFQPQCTPINVQTCNRHVFGHVSSENILPIDYFYLPSFTSTVYIRKSMMLRRKFIHKFGQQLKVTSACNANVKPILHIPNNEYNPHQYVRHIDQESLE